MTVLYHKPSERRELTRLQTMGARIEGGLLVIPRSMPLSTLDVLAIERLCADGKWDWIYDTDR
jgi:hypothetical protein